MRIFFEAPGISGLGTRFEQLRGLRILLPLQASGSSWGWPLKPKPEDKPEDHGETNLEGRIWADLAEMGGIGESKMIASILGSVTSHGLNLLGGLAFRERSSCSLEWPPMEIC